MPYLARKHQLISSLLYHIFNCGNGRSEIFHSPEDYQQFITILSGYARDNNVCIYHWVLMPNHYHLLLELDEPERLSSIMAGIGRSYVYYHHKAYQSAGHLWQGRFKSQPIEKERYLLACGRYIERGPVKTNMVIGAENYPYSSAAYYVLGKEDGLTKQDPLFESFGSQLGQRQEKYKKFLRAFDQEKEEEEEMLFRNLEFPRGSKGFLDRLIKKKRLFLPKRRGRPKK